MPRASLKGTYNRWVAVSHTDNFARVLRAAEQIGLGCVDAWKPGLCAWYAMRFKGARSQIMQLDEWAAANDVELFRRPPAGAWAANGADVIPWADVWKNLNGDQQ